MAATSCTPPNYCAHTPQLICAHPPLNRLRFFLFRLEHHVCLTRLHPNREDNARPYPNQHLVFAYFSPHLPWLLTHLRWGCAIAQTLPLMILMSSPKGSAIQCQRMVVEVKIRLRMVCQLLAAIFHRLTAVVGPCPFGATLLRGPLVRSGFNLNSITCTIVKIKT